MQFNLVAELILLLYAPLMAQRHYTLFDRTLIQLDTGLRTLFGRLPATGRPDPAKHLSEPKLTEDERELAGRLMRINHAGEIAAQGLYQGQAMTAQGLEVRKKMAQSAEEENDHLNWCASRINALGTYTSVLNPLWYVGSVTIGALAGLAGDKWSLGFVVETEQQVVRHLDGHLARLPSKDVKSRAILEQMKVDEAQHATKALNIGAASLPNPIKRFMALSSKAMTNTAYWI